MTLCVLGKGAENGTHFESECRTTVLPQRGVLVVAESLYCTKNHFVHDVNI